MCTSSGTSPLLVRLAAIVLVFAVASGKVAGDDAESPPAAVKFHIVHSGRVMKLRGVRLEIVAIADDPAEVAAADMPNRQIRLADGAFDEMLFGKVSNAADLRLRLGRAVSARVESVNRICELTDAQKQKLQLACRGDIKRLFDSVDVLRQKCETFYIDGENVREVPSFVDELSRQAAPLRASLLSGPFGDDSLFAKTLRHTLTPEQAAKYHSQRNGRQAASTTRD